MFVLAELKDTVKISPWQFKQNRMDAIVDILNKKLANKVVHQLGLCVALWDIKKVDDAFLFPGDGASHTMVNFRYVVFRPFIDEILIGKIKGCSKEGVHVTMNFFDDILIPASQLQSQSRFDEEEQIWIWGWSDGAEGDAESHDLFMDVGEEIRFRVIEEVFVDTSPTGPHGAASLEVTEDKEKVCPYMITGSISEPGLGLLTWWADSN